jgi:hypothetical protein
VKSVPITYRGMNLFQRWDLKVYGVDPADLSVCLVPLSVGEGNILTASDEDSAMWIRGYRPEEPMKLWDALESSLWNKRKEPEPESEDDQVELGEGTEGAED